jgi:predicted nucleic acid-binding protein
MIYFDSSALVKRYIEESGSDVVQSLLDRDASAATSKLAYPEILSALTRKQRSGELTKRSLQAAVSQFEADWAGIVVVEFHDELLPTMKSLLLKHHLRGADTVHLASALWLKRAVQSDLAFVASDLNLLKAAQAERLEVINPQ